LSEASSDPSAGKAARNESRKLTATAVNNLAVALLLAAFIQPTLSVVQQARDLSLAELIASAIFVLLSALCFSAVRLIALRIED
jgi:hypothetical protein